MEVVLDCQQAADLDPWFVVEGNDDDDTYLARSLWPTALPLTVMLRVCATGRSPSPSATRAMPHPQQDASP